MVLKVQPLGGLEATKQVAQKALQAGLEVVVSSALETSAGLYRGAQMVGWLEERGSGVLDAGLGTQSFLTDDVVSDPLVASGGILTVAPPALDSQKLLKLKANDERTDWWLQRLERCLALL